MNKPRCTSPYYHVDWQAVDTVPCFPVPHVRISWMYAEFRNRSISSARTSAQNRKDKAHRAIKEWSDHTRTRYSRFKCEAGTPSEDVMSGVRQAVAPAARPGIEAAPVRVATIVCGTIYIHTAVNSFLARFLLEG